MFDFIDGVKTSVVDIYTTITNVSVSPSFSITFDNKYLKGTYKIVDLSWYAPYKEYGDNVICMFVYLGFIWGVFKNLANIISGAGSDYKSFKVAEDEHNWFMQHSTKIRN